MSDSKTYRKRCAAKVVGSKKRRGGPKKGGAKSQAKKAKKADGAKSQAELRQKAAATKNRKERKGAVLGNLPDEKLSLVVAGDVQQKRSSEEQLKAISHSSDDDMPELAGSEDDGVGSDGEQVGEQAMEEDKEGRQTTWLDDLIVVVQSGLGSVSPDFYQWGPLRKAVRDGYVFAFQKKFSGTSGEFGWVVVRGSLKARIAITHGNARVLERPKAEEHFAKHN